MSEEHCHASRGDGFVVVRPRARLGRSNDVVQHLEHLVLSTHLSLGRGRDNISLFLFLHRTSRNYCSSYCIIISQALDLVFSVNRPVWIP